MTANPKISLEHFYVFNSTLSKKEGEEDKKILYYYPMMDIEVQMKNIGFSEAIIKFTESFNPGQACDFCQTGKTRQIYYQPETDFWMVMIVGVPWILKEKDGTKYKEYQNDEVSSNVCQAILKQAYVMFRLFMGSFDTILNDPECGSETLLKCKLDHFYSRYLLSLNLNTADILDIFQGLQFLPLDKTTFLRVQCFMNLVEAMFSQVKYTAFLYNDQLVWSGLEPEDMQVVYNFLLSTVLPVQLESELRGGSMPRNSSPFTSSHFGKFVTGPLSSNESNLKGQPPKVFLNYSTKPISLYLIVYRSLSATICLFVDSKTNLSMEFYKSLDDFLGPQLTTLVNSVAEQCSKHLTSTSENSTKYLYFNKLNLAYKSTVHMDNRHCSSRRLNVGVDNILTTPEELKIITDINSDTRRLKEAGETIITTRSDYWVVGKVSNLREFFIVVKQNNANIIHIDDEVKRLCDKQLKSIFFH